MWIPCGRECKWLDSTYCVMYAYFDALRVGVVFMCWSRSLQDVIHKVALACAPSDTVTELLMPWLTSSHKSFRFVVETCWNDTVWPLWSSPKKKTGKWLFTKGVGLGVMVLGSCIHCVILNFSSHSACFFVFFNCEEVFSCSCTCVYVRSIPDFQPWA